MSSVEEVQALAERAKKRRDNLLNQIVDTATGAVSDGHRSVWLDVFADDLPMSKALVDAFIRHGEAKHG